MIVPLSSYTVSLRNVDVVSTFPRVLLWSYPSPYILTLILCACVCMKEEDRIEHRTYLKVVFLWLTDTKKRFAKCGIEPETSSL